MSNVIARCGQYLSDLLLGEIVAEGAEARLRSQDRDPRPENKTTKFDENKNEGRTENQAHNPRPSPTHQNPNSPTSPTPWGKCPWKIESLLKTCGTLMASLKATTGISHAQNPTAVKFAWSRQAKASP
ncbi:hypothetical protein E4U47_007459 [Claviceps purpurea]|nr:hypothetical protein E4U47_007459 [Claviceps purpurea]